MSGARSYIFELATTEDFSALVGESPRVVETTSVAISLPVGTYWWRARSDLTTSDIASGASRFGVLGESLYVHCAGSASCDQDVGPRELGTPQLPYRSINRASVAARAAQRPEVRVAARDTANTPYDEQVFVEPGIVLVGGYDVSFNTRSGRTNVARRGIGLSAVGVDTPTRVEHFSFRTLAGDLEASSTALFLFDDTSDLILRDVAAVADAVVDNVVRIESSSRSEGPRFESCEITGVYAASRLDVPVEVNLIVATTAAVTLVDTTVTGDFSSPDPPSVLVLPYWSLLKARVSDVIVTSSTLQATGPSFVQYLYGVDVQPGSFDMQRSTLSLQAEEVDFVTGLRATGVVLNIDSADINVQGDAEARGVDAGVPSISLERSTVVSTADTAVAIRANAQALGRITANVAEAYGATRSTGIRVESGIFTVANNTIVVGEGTQQYGVFAAGSHAVIVNNLVLATGNDCGASQCRIAAAIQDQTNEYVIAFVGNAAVGFSATDCMYAFDTTLSACISPSTVLDPGTMPPFFAANQVIAAREDARLTNDNRLADTVGPLYRQGYPTDLDNCRRSSLSMVALPTPSCGGTFVDRGGAPYGSPPSIGAYEL